MESTNPPGTHPVRLTASNIQDVLSRYDTLILDNDGTLWNNNQTTKLEGVPATVEKLRRLGKRFIFLSNNPYHNKESFVKKFARLGDFSAGPDEIVLAKDALITYMRDFAGVKGKVYCICGEGLQKYLEDAGFCTTGAGANPEPDVTDFEGGMKEFYSMKLETDVGAVVVTLDGCFNFNKCFKALNYLSNPDCHLITVGKEPNIKLSMAGLTRILPGPGCIVAALEVGSGKKATTIAKPSPTLFEYVKREHPQLDQTRTIMIGDSLESDIRFAANSGLDSILVCTGTDNEQTTMEAFKKNPDVALPTYVIDSFGDICKLL